MVESVTDILEDIYTFAKICDELEENEYWKSVKDPNINLKNCFFSDIESIILYCARDKKTVKNNQTFYNFESIKQAPIIIIILSKIKEHSEIKIEKELNFSLLEYVATLFDKIEKTVSYMFVPERLPY